MKKAKIETACLLYLILSIAYMQFAFNTEIYDSLYFIKEDLFFILILFFVFDQASSSTGKLIVTTVIFYRTIMLCSNVYSLININIIFSNLFILIVSIFVLAILLFIKWLK